MTATVTQMSDYLADRNARLAAWFRQEIEREAALGWAWYLSGRPMVCPPASTLRPVS